MNNISIEQKYTAQAEHILVGRTIRKVYYISEKEAENNYWGSRGLVIQLDNGEEFIALADEEGNDCGAYHFGDGTIIPRI